MQNPPATFQEFLHFKLLKDWPEIPSVEEHLYTELIPDHRYSLDMIHKQFLVNAPFSVSAFGNMEAKIDKNIALLDNYVSHILCLPAQDDDKHSSARVFLTEADMPVPSKNVQEKIKPFSRINHKEEDLSAESFVFPGCDKTDLPGKLKAHHILQNVAKFQKLKEGTRKIISTLLLSAKSVAIFQDCFWWFFLHIFKPQKIQQDYLFDRMSDSFVSLFCSISLDIKDHFFQIYPDFLSQAIFTAFYKTFPQSRTQLNIEFKTEIVDLIFQWVSGIKPVPCSWEKWDLGILEMNDEISHEDINFSLNCYVTDVRKLKFNLDDLVYEARQLHVPKTLDIEGKDTPTTESHTIGPGPEFRHVLFKLGSHSLLVSNYMKRHQFTGCIHERPQQRIKRTEILHLPPAGPTYQDIIQETQNLRNSVQMKYEMLEAKTQKDLAEIQHQNAKVKCKIEKMKQELSSGVKLNNTRLLERLQKMPFSSKLFRKKDLTIQDVLDADDECAPTAEQTLVML
ncbi:protein FAM227B isoform X3 [Engystomops pustulosus]